MLRELCGTCRDAPNADGLRAYERLLSDIDPDCLQRAAHRHLFEAKDRWFPSVGRLRELAVECGHGTVPGWDVAWERIQEAVKVWDQYDSGRAIKAREMLGETLMGFVRLLGGFDVLKDANVTQTSVLRGQFRDAWGNRKEEIERDRLLPQYLRPRQNIPGEIAPKAISEKPRSQPKPQRRIEQRTREQITDAAAVVKSATEPVKRPQKTADEQLRGLAKLQSKGTENQ